MNLAVVGGTGFIGHEIVAQAVRRGDQVRAIARTAASVPDQASFIAADIRDHDSLRAAFAGIDVVINSAGLAHGRPETRQAQQYEATNATGAAAVVVAAAESGVRRVVLLSSISIYGGSTPDTLLNEQHTPAPKGPYAISKWNGETVAAQMAQTHNLPLTTLRLATVYGGSDPGNFIRLIRMIARGKFVWVGNGANRKTVIHREDVARGALLAASDTTSGSGIFNLTDNVYTIRQIVETMADLLHQEVGSRYIPTVAARTIAKIIAKGGSRGRAFATTIDRWLADEAYSGDAFKKRYAFCPAWNLRDGLAEEIRWLRQTQGLD